MGRHAPAAFYKTMKLAMTWVVLVLAASARAADTHWLDIESRIQYAYFTEDLRALRNLSESLAASDSQDPLKGYYAGLLAYRLTVLSAPAGDATPRKNDRSKNEARQTVERCISSLDAALTVKGDFADALALQAACLDLQAGLTTWRGPFATSKSTSEIRKAVQLAPANPRVLLLDAIGSYEHGQRAPQPCAQFKSVTALFESERADVDHVPGWGAAEAYTWLGQCYLDEGNPNAARDALERALLIAPEFSQARRLLRTITSG